MKHEIIKTDNYLLVVDYSVIKDVRPYKGKWQLEKGYILNKFPTYLTDLSDCKIVIAHLPLNGSPILKGVDLLPQLENEVDVEKMAFGQYGNGEDNRTMNAFIDGYTQALEDNKDKKYTEEDLRKAIDRARDYCDGWVETEDEIVQSLSQPKIPIGFELQIGVCERWLNEDCTDNCCGIPEKKITTTTPEGHTQWVGKYIYE